MMKLINKIYKVPALIICVLVLNACFDLDQENPNQLTEEEFWSTEDQLRQGAVAAYDALQTNGLYGQNIHIVFTGLSDEGTNETPFEFNQFVRFTLEETGELNDPFWIDHYSLIGRAYQVIERSENFNVPDIVAEMKFFVALGYFNLVTYFGENIAYVDRIQNPVDRPRRAESGELYALMEQMLIEATPDLRLASELSSTGADYGRVTRGAAQTLLAKIYMQQGNYAGAEPLLDAVISSNEYQLLSDYADNFRETGAVNPEAIFVVNFLHKGPENETNWNRRFQLFSMAELLGSFGDFMATNFVLEEFNTENDADGNPDPRRDVTIFSEDSQAPFNLYYGQAYPFWEAALPNPDVNTGFMKYSEQDEVSANDPIQANERDGGTDYLLFRYADVLLMYAEVLNELGRTSEAYPFVNQVRARANMRDLEVAEPGIGNDQAAFLTQLQHERLVELAGENWRFFDLKRWDMYNSDNTNDPNFASWTSEDALGKIPVSELDLNNNLTQNPGY